MTMQTPLEHRLGDMAFYWRMRATGAPPHPCIPAFLPFAFSFNPELQLVVQARRDETLHWLAEVYKEDQNVGYLQDGHALAAAYGDDFLGFIDGSCDAASQSFIEVGCGGAYLLARLKARGHAVQGVDPSPVAVRAAERLGVPMVADFYPSTKLVERADTIFHYDVLEHVDNPAAFLRAHHDNLRPGGHVIVAVPDCTPSIRIGDASMAIHEHLNYFDADSLDRTLRMAGFRPLRIEASRHGGVLYAFARSEPDIASASAPEQLTRKFELFSDGLHALTSRLREFAARHATSPRGLALYIPLRLMPYLATGDDWPHVRFFDDDPGILGKCFDGYDFPVENFEGFVATPPSGAIIGSFAFADRIGQKIRAKLGNGVEIMALADFVAPR